MLSKRLKWCHLELEGRGLADVLTNHISNVCGSGCRCVFGGCIPFAKELVGLLYVGSGIGLIVTCLIKDHGWHHSGLVKDDWIWRNFRTCIINVWPTVNKCRNNFYIIES